MSLKATWTIAWEDASTARNAQVSTEQQQEAPVSVAAPSVVQTPEEAQKILEDEGRAPERLSPGEFSSRVKELTTAGGTIETKLIQGCDEVLARMKSEKEKSSEFSTPDILELLHSRKFAADGTTITPSAEKLKWFQINSHNAVTDALEVLDAALLCSGWQASTYGPFFRHFKDFSRAREAESLQVMDIIYSALTEITVRTSAGSSFQKATEDLISDVDLMKKLQAAAQQRSMTNPPGRPDRAQSATNPPSQNRRSESPRQRSRSRSARRDARGDKPARD